MSMIASCQEVSFDKMLEYSHVPNRRHGSKKANTAHIHVLEFQEKGLSIETIDIFGQKRPNKKFPLKLLNRNFAILTTSTCRKMEEMYVSKASTRLTRFDKACQSSLLAKTAYLECNE